MKWEYIEKFLSDSRQTLDTLNRQGAEGWELCGITKRQGDAVMLYFKRPKEEEEF